MEVILLEKNRLGAIGDKVIVKPGYARNFLFPQRRALPATKANLIEFEKRRADLEKAAAQALAAAQKRAEAIMQQARITITAQAGEEGKLFGSVGTKDIADAVTAAGVAVEKSEVHLPAGALRNTGEFEISISVHPDVHAVITLVIEAE